MSIFPKRLLPGATVTIHWNYNTSRLREHHLMPWVKIGIRYPDGRVVMLFEKHVLSLPQEQEVPAREEPKLQYLNKNLPLLILADCLSGKYKKEKLVQILQNLQSGRHYYFAHTLPPDAPLGRYELVSELHVEGEVKYSNTAADDFFWVEKVSFEGLVESGGERQALIRNHSPEATPVKLVACERPALRQLRTKVKVFELPPLSENPIGLSAPLNFLLYNEEREVIPLLSGAPVFLLRNQQVLEYTKPDGSTFLFKNGDDGTYELREETKTLWQKADGLLQKEGLSAEEQLVFEEMEAEGLLGEISFASLGKKATPNVSLT